MWFHEKLGLLAPPQNISRYRAKNCRTRALQPIPEDIHSWLSTFPETQIRWTCPWWRLQYVTLRSYTHCVPIAGLHQATFYNPARLCRQYGQKQWIPKFMPKFESGPLTQNFLDNLAATWPRRTIQRGINHDGDPSTDDRYKEWIRAHEAGGDGSVRFQHTSDLQATSSQNIPKRRRQG